MALNLRGDPDPSKRDCPLRVSADAAQGVPVMNKQANTPKRLPEANTGENKKAKSEVISVQADSHELGSSDSLQISKPNGAREKSKSTRKRSPKLMRIVLDALTELPILSSAARKAGIHFKTLQYWLKCSNAGYDGYDLEWRGVKRRFHEHCDSAIGRAHDTLRDVVVAIAMGYQIKTDPFLVDVVGCRGLDAYAKDRNGDFTLGPSGPPNPKMLRFYLQWRFPEKYGKHRKIEAPETGGVLVIGMPQPPDNKPKPSTASAKTRKWKSIARKIRDA
jgi:hypothetical protein